MDMDQCLSPSNFFLSSIKLISKISVLFIFIISINVILINATIAAGYNNRGITMNLPPHPPIFGMRAAKITDKFIENNKINNDHNDAEDILIKRNISKNSIIRHYPYMTVAEIEDQQNGLKILNNIVKESFIRPTINELWNQRNGRRRIFSDIPAYIGKVVRGLTNLTVAIGRTINSENGNGSLSRLITHRLVGVSESLMGWVERSVDDLPSIPRLDAQECMKRSICEAHNQPKKYGAVGLIIQLFFPPYLDSEDANKIVSKYQLAARYGRGENANCAAQYDDCMLNVLDLLQGAINMLF